MTMIRNPCVNTKFVAILWSTTTALCHNLESDMLSY